MIEITGFSIGCAVYTYCWLVVRDYRRFCVREQDKEMVEVFE